MRRSVIIALGAGEPGSKAPPSGTQRANGGGFGTVQFNKKFVAPTPVSRRGALAVKNGNSDAGGRKRKRVNYAEAGGGADDAGDGDVVDAAKAEARAKAKAKFGMGAKPGKGGDDDDKPKKKRKTDDPYDEIDAPRVWDRFEPKGPPDETIKKSFAVPEMRNRKTGEIVVPRLTHGALGVCRRMAQIPRPLFNPLADHAIVLWDPTVDDVEGQKRRREAAVQRAKERAQQGDGPHKSLAAILGLDKAVDTEPVRVPVVIDPRLCKVLRPHQVEGVKFLYKAATGMITENAFGCIMADEMGLGKTLQCITLMWTLLQQSPTPGKSTVDKAIVVCPASLVRNWANELVKWLGAGAINPLAIDGSQTKADMIASVRQWCATTGRSVSQPVIIVSYESLRNLGEQLGQTQVGLLLCDEAHRLKNSDNQTYTSLSKLNVQRRVLLTGTPVQNDLTEYFSLLNFALPSYLGTRLEFRKNYELAIAKGRDADASEVQREKCQEKLKELAVLVNRFVIRRTNDLLTKYLPVKYEHVVFCTLSPFQIALYNKMITSPETRALISASGGNPLVAIGMFQKLCNHPDLLDLTNISDAKDIFPDGYDPNKKRRDIVPAFSGKMLVLERFLDKMHAESDDKIVLISNYTETLDCFERLLRAKRYGYFRLEGSTQLKKRQKLVDQFNDPQRKEFVFLLSSKAGGCGINLIGANRLILFDPDWNPASDQQALARVWRDGQKKACFVYRFIATGTVEEKIFQRQAHKQALSSAVVDNNESAERHFSVGELKKLFLYNDKTDSETHDTFKCKRCRDGKQILKSKAMLYGDTSTWNHLGNDDLKDIHDESGLGVVSKCFRTVYQLVIAWPFRSDRTSFPFVYIPLVVRCMARCPGRVAAA